MTSPTPSFPGWTRRATLGALGAGFGWPALWLDAQNAPPAGSWQVEAAFLSLRNPENREILRYWRQKPADSPVASPSACYFHPFTTPSGQTLTDLAPDDHPHHRGIFLAWLEVRTAHTAGDFWGWGQPAPTEGRRLVHTGVEKTTVISHEASFTVTNEWRAQDTVLLRERLTSTLRHTPEGRVLDLDYTFTAPEDTTLGQWAFSGFCMRLRKDGRLTLHDPDGPVTRPAPSHLEPATDWPDRPWYAAHLELPDGTELGAAVLNHPHNPRTLWHNVAGIAMLNPCHIAPGSITLSPRTPLRLRYRVVGFDGPVPTAALNELAAAFPRPDSK